jgi:hypothetical protein
MIVLIPSHDCLPGIEPEQVWLMIVLIPSHDCLPGIESEQVWLMIVLIPSHDCLPGIEPEQVWLMIVLILSHHNEIPFRIKDDHGRAVEGISFVTDIAQLGVPLYCSIFSVHKVLLILEILATFLIENKGGALQAVLGFRKSALQI